MTAEQNLRAALRESMRLDPPPGASCSAPIKPRKDDSVAMIDPQEFGRLEARVEQLIKADEAKTALLERLFVRLDSIDRQMSEARGGWKVLLALTGLAGTLGATAGAWVSHLLGKGPLQ